MIIPGVDIKTVFVQRTIFQHFPTILNTVAFVIVIVENFPKRLLTVRFQTNLIRRRCGTYIQFTSISPQQFSNKQVADVW